MHVQFAVPVAKFPCGKRAQQLQKAINSASKASKTPTPSTSIFTEPSSVKKPRKQSNLAATASTAMLSCTGKIINNNNNIYSYRFQHNFKTKKQLAISTIDNNI